MSKINTRSPFYASFSTPTKPSPEFTCTIANGTGLSISQEGIITEPQFEQGTIDSFTSSDSGFADGKYAVVTTDTLRTLVFRLLIPSGFSNTSSGFLDCTLTFTQPAKVTTGTTPSCSGGPTLNGSIPGVALNAGGNTSTINLASYFTQGTSSIAGFTVNNPNPSFMQASVSSSTLTITSLNNGGVKKLYVSAFDNDTNTCRPVQTITVTITASSAFTCTDANLKGGSITQAGVLTDPALVGTITARKLSSGGSAFSGPPYNVGASSATGSVSKTIFFDVTVPSNYTNAGATIECSLAIPQAGTGLDAMTCSDVTLTEQSIYTDGTIKKGKVTIKGTEGTIASFDPVDFGIVSTRTARNIDFTITVPSGFSNTGSSVVCSKQVFQPPELNVCNFDGGDTYYMDLIGFPSEQDICESGFPRARTAVFCTSDEIDTAFGHTVCINNQPFKGFGQFYVVDTFINNNIARSNSGTFYIWQIGNNGVIEDVWEYDCEGGGIGSGNSVI